MEKKDQQCQGFEHPFMIKMSSERIHGTHFFMVLTLFMVQPLMEIINHKRELKKIQLSLGWNQSSLGLRAQNLKNNLYIRKNGFLYNSTWIHVTIPNQNNLKEKNLFLSENVPISVI